MIDKSLFCLWFTLLIDFDNTKVIIVSLALLFIGELYIPSQSLSESLVCYFPWRSACTLFSFLRHWQNFTLSLLYIREFTHESFCIILASSAHQTSRKGRFNEAKIRYSTLTLMTQALIHAIAILSRGGFRQNDGCIDLAATEMMAG